MLAIGVTCLLFLDTTGAEILKSDREVEGLKGAVHMVIEDWGANRRMTTYYDRAGNLIKFEMSYRSNDKTRTEKLRSVFEHDASGRRTISKSFGADGLPLDEIHYSYDDKGNLIEQGNYRNAELLFKFVYAYDDQGHRLEMKTYLHDGSLKSKSVYTYDSKGNIATMASYKDCMSENSCRLDYKAVDTYDEQGYLSEARIFKADGTLDEKRTHKYDASGNQIEQSVFRSDGSLRDKEITTYVYDSNGNWTQRTTKSALKNGKPSQETAVTKRRISYHGELNPER